MAQLQRPPRLPPQALMLAERPLLAQALPPIVVLLAALAFRWLRMEIPPFPCRYQACVVQLLALLEVQPLWLWVSPATVAH